MNRNRRCLH